MAWRACVVAIACLLPAAAQTPCRFYLAYQSDSTSGLDFFLEGQPDASHVCPLSSLSLALSVGDGKGFHRVSASRSWQTGVVYTAKAVISGAGPQQLSLNGQSIGTAQAVFKPNPGAFFGSYVAGGTPGYVVRQISLSVSNGSGTMSLAPNGADAVPLPLVLMSGPVLWPAPLTIDPSQPTTITATFRIDPAVASPHQFDPFVDIYGQTEYSAWASKASSSDDLQNAATEEQAWLAANQPPGGTDMYGGSTLAGWTDQATGYYHTLFANNRWWLISPLGNPMFYIGLSGMYEDATPITGRQAMFAALPPMTGQFAPAWSQNIYNDKPNTTYHSFATANLVRKYGSGWRDAKDSINMQRLAAWGFAGSGKWTHPQDGLPVNPVLKHSAVPNVTAGGHPDVFDPAIVNQLAATLTDQIGADATNPYIIGWSVGNETDELVASSEVQPIMALGASVAAKKALVDQALAAIYGGSVGQLAAAWKITASSVSDVYGAKPSLPASDLEALRQYYEGVYYSTLYQTVKSIDPNHLYLGSWILPREFPADWPIAAANCDVAGIDLYVPAFTADVAALVNSAGMPVLIGEFSFPSGYGGMRGFGSDKYTGEITFSESASGDAYTQWLSDTSANPFIVGVEWFSYRDEPITGRGNNDGIGNASSSLVIGENFAFGVVDIADRPKYDLVNKVRAANIAAQQSLGLLGP